MPLKHAKLLYPVSEHTTIVNNYNNIIIAINEVFAHTTGLRMPVEEAQGTDSKFSSTMSDGDFFKWLRSKGINEKDCNTLLGMYSCIVACKSTRLA